MYFHVCFSCFYHVCACVHVCFRYVCMFSGLWPAAVSTILGRPDQALFLCYCFPPSFTPNPHPVHRELSGAVSQVRTTSSPPSCVPGPPISVLQVRPASAGSLRAMPLPCLLAHLPCVYLHRSGSCQPEAPCQSKPKHPTACGSFLQLRCLRPVLEFPEFPPSSFSSLS